MHTTFYESMHFGLNGGDGPHMMRLLSFARDYKR